MKYRIYQDRKGEWRWHLQAANGNRLADSGEGYVSRKDCEGGIERVKDSKGAPVEECDPPE